MTPRPKLTKEEYMRYLDELGIPEHERMRHGGPIPNRARYYGHWLREHDMPRFNVGFEQWRRAALLAETPQ